MGDLRATLADFGDAAGLRWLNTDGPDLLPYATLLNARRGGHDVLSSVNAVYEWQGVPLIFLLDADTVQDDNQLRHLRRLLAMRGDAPYLGIVSPGRLDVYRLALDHKTPAQAHVELDVSGGLHATLVQLGNTRPDVAANQRNWISNVILRSCTCITTGKRSQPRKSGSVYVTDSGGARPHSGR